MRRDSDEVEIPLVTGAVAADEDLGEVRRRLSEHTAQLERRMATIRGRGPSAEVDVAPSPAPPRGASVGSTLAGMPERWPLLSLDEPEAGRTRETNDGPPRDAAPSSPPDLSSSPEPSTAPKTSSPAKAPPPAAPPATGGPAGTRAVALGRLHAAGPISTLRYPNHGKLTTGAPPSGLAILGEPAEPLFIAVVTGAHELGATIIRQTFLEDRAPRHSVSLYRWQDEVTLDWIGFDAIDDLAGRADGHVDLLLLSDQIADPATGGASARTVQSAALRARLAFPRAFVAGLCRDPVGPRRPGHPFATIERRASERGVPIFDDHLVGEVTVPKISRLLVALAKSDRYALHRRVWRRGPDSAALVAAVKAAPARTTRGS